MIVVELREVEATARSLGLEVAHSKSGDATISPAFEARSRAAPTPFMSCRSAGYQ